MATGYDPLLDTEPELACTMAAPVTQRIAFGERAGEQVRRIGAGFGYKGECPELTGPRCASVNGVSLHANTAIPAHRRDQLGCLIRYTARGAVSLERLTEDDSGDLVTGGLPRTHPGRGHTRCQSCSLAHQHVAHLRQCLPTGAVGLRSHLIAVLQDDAAK